MTLNSETNQVTHLYLCRLLSPAVTIDDIHSLDAELFEDDELTGVNQSDLLTHYLDRCCIQEQLLISLSELSLNVVCLCQVH